MQAERARFVCKVRAVHFAGMQHVMDCRKYTENKLTCLPWTCAGGQLDYKTDKWAWREGLHGPPDFYEPVITSYDYGSPISEAGDTGQPGLGGPNSFKVCYYLHATDFLRPRRMS